MRTLIAISALWLALLLGGCTHGYVNYASEGDLVAADDYQPAHDSSPFYDGGNIEPSPLSMDRLRPVFQ